jgi:hypothetical protein
MGYRSFLRGNLLAAWRRTIRHHYQRQQINSEHGLQVFFCAALLSEFRAAGDHRRARIRLTRRNQGVTARCTCQSADLGFQPRN